jgi:predicted nucleic acid-binding protein
MSQPVLYVDTSAFLKLLVREKESGPLREALTDASLWSSTLLDVEAHRSARRLGVAADDVATALDKVALLAPTASTFASARDIGPTTLRTLDALHLATALELGSELEAVVTYDDRLAAGCASVSLAVLSPN